MELFSQCVWFFLSHEIKSYYLYEWKEKRIISLSEQFHIQ